MPADERKVIARRAAFELRPATWSTSASGISAAIAHVAAEEGIERRRSRSPWSGRDRRRAGPRRDFGSADNPDAIVDQPYQFDFYDGGGLDVRVPLVRRGRRARATSTSRRFGDRYDGSGGFINISQNAKRLVFSGTFTGGRLEVGIENGRLIIRKDGGSASWYGASGRSASTAGSPANGDRRSCSFPSARCSGWSRKGWC